MDMGIENREGGVGMMIGLRGIEGIEVTGETGETEEIAGVIEEVMAIDMSRGEIETKAMGARTGRRRGRRNGRGMTKMSRLR